MNGYPYPVLTETASAYKADRKFNINFSKHTFNQNELSIVLENMLSSDTLLDHISTHKAKIVVKVVTDIRSMMFHFSDFSERIEVKIKSEDIKANDTIKITAFIVAAKAFSLVVTDEMEDYFGENYSIALKKGDVLAVSNVEKLNYNTTTNDFIMIKSASDMTDKGLKIRLSNDNHIEILVGPEFKHAYATLKDPRISPLLGSHLVFEAFLYTLVEIAQGKEDHSHKEWYRLFSQAFEVTGDTLDDFIQKAADDGGVDISYIYEVAQIMISNSLENTIIKISKSEVC